MIEARIVRWGIAGCLGLAIALWGCTGLLASAVGAPVITKTEFQITNDSNYEVCKVVAKNAQGDEVSSNALAGGALGIDPGTSGVALVDDRTGPVVLEVYGCDSFGRQTLLDTVQNDTTNPQPVRVR